MGYLIHYLFIARFLLGGLHGEMVLDVPELREGIPGNITCSVNKVKRPAKIELSLGNKSLPEIRQENKYDEASGTYTSIKTVTEIDRSWNDKSFACLSYIQGPTNDSYAFHAFKNQTVVFKYPPSSMIMTSQETPINMLPWYPLTIICAAIDSNADCMIKWTSDLPDLHLISKTQEGHRDIVSTIQVNVSQGNSGHNISCHTECVDFVVHFIKVYTIDLPRPPTITIRPAYEKSVTGNLVGVLECEADNNPIGNISWIAKQTNDTQINCYNSTVCLLQLNETTVASVTQYACFAVNVHGQDHKSFKATNADGDTATDGSEGKLVFMNALIISVVCLVLCFGLFLGCVVYKRLTQSDEVIRSKGMSSDVATNFQPSTPGNASVQHEIHEPRYANNLASVINRSCTQVDGVNQLIYADIDIEFLEQNRAARSTQGETAHTVYTSVRFTRETERNPAC
ncbi:uncharacterized protein LOC127850276 isoform X2 [Dreissena polymorpha]|uniref:uncharacterized protein LOC127850276 isoform X2 n=1 Tax=Dreissena polymorpha TaxID=45954 RepID=UPI0022645A63|nr:uncharacterized protein LOC127850276 isoform X2 [Dreissena polymorpha]